MKRTVRILSLVLCAAILLALPVHADAEIAPYASDFFTSFTTGLEQVRDSAFQIHFGVTSARGLLDELGTSEIIVQRSSDGVNWETMATYTPTIRPNMVAYDTAFHSGYIVYAGTQGYYYRARVTYYAKDERGTAYYDHWTQTLFLQPMSS